MKLFYKILFIFLGKGLFSLPLHNPGRITSILTHINTFISELVFSLGERREEFRMGHTCTMETFLLVIKCFRRHAIRLSCLSFKTAKCWIQTSPSNRLCPSHISQTLSSRYVFSFVMSFRIIHFILISTAHALFLTCPPVTSVKNVQGCF